MTWDYLIWVGAEVTYAHLEQLGLDGWELVSLMHVPIPAEWPLQAVFKRPKVTP